jgi:hypothetical protein
MPGLSISGEMPMKELVKEIKRFQKDCDKQKQIESEYVDFEEIPDKPSKKDEVKKIE